MVPTDYGQRQWQNDRQHIFYAIVKISSTEDLCLAVVPNAFHTDYQLQIPAPTARYRSKTDVEVANAIEIREPSGIADRRHISDRKPAFFGSTPLENLR